MRAVAVAVALAVVVLLLAPRAHAQDPPVYAPPPAAPPPPASSSPPDSAFPEYRPHRAARESRLLGSLEAGYSYQSLYGIPMQGVDITGILGAQIGTLGVGGAIDVAPAHTKSGLQALTASLGLVLQATVDRVRIGGGLRLGGIEINRATSAGTIGTLSTGIFGRFSVDLIQFDDEGNGALFLVIKGSVDDAGAALFGASAGAGVRF
jgi:hypothetical protein